jgi:hypothetical protein
VREGRRAHQRDARARGRVVRYTTLDDPENTQTLGTELARAIAGRSWFAVRFCHVRRKACVAAPSMMHPVQQRVAHCVDDCFKMNTP